MHTMNNSALRAQLETGLTLNLNGEYALIRVSGADAKAFLHTQFTQDIAHLADNEVRLGGYCSAKGRLYAIFYAYAEDETVFLLMHHSVAETVIKRLRMFVLRMKAAEFGVDGVGFLSCILVLIRLAHDLRKLFHELKAA